MKSTHNKGQKVMNNNGMFVGMTYDDGVTIEFISTKYAQDLKESLKKCRCETATFTRTVDEKFNPMCAKCGKQI